ncbi:MAG: glycosyltransferase [Candidatus Eremiobacterota bacterium]
MRALLTFLFLSVNALLALYACHILLLTGLFLLRQRLRQAGRGGPPTLNTFPRVTVQLPLYNEASVVVRLLLAVAALDYPRDRLQIQVLDDSTDQTTEIALATVRQLREGGVDIELVRRPDRNGFKAGAMAHGLQTATGEFVAVFDADFVPAPDFLQRLLPELLADPGLAFVQARWGHLNRDYSAITRMQSLAIDSHFVVDQVVRHWAGFPMHFNGTGGIWRRTAIEQSGGWQADTLCEDLDLSYRAILQGWKPGYMPEVVVPAELSPQLTAFKQQQFRWARGSIQCTRKLLGPIWRSSLVWWKKILATLHLSGYMINPLVLALVLLTPLFALAQGPAMDLGPLWIVSVFALSFPLFYAAALRSVYPSWLLCVLTELPILLLVGCGMALNNSLAILAAVRSNAVSRFERTPKFNVVRAADRWREHPYRLPVQGLVLAEVGLCLYSLAGCWLVATWGPWLMVPATLYYAASFGVLAGLGIWEARDELAGWLRDHVLP